MPPLNLSNLSPLSSFPYTMALYNEILAEARMKSAGADEICFADEIKSTHPVLTPDFIPKGDFIIEDDLFHPTGWI